MSLLPVVRTQQFQSFVLSSELHVTSNVLLARWNGFRELYLLELSKSKCIMISIVKAAAFSGICCSRCAVLHTKVAQNPHAMLVQKAMLPGKGMTSFCSVIFLAESIITAKYSWKGEICDGTQGRLTKYGVQVLLGQSPGS